MSTSRSSSSIGLGGDLDLAVRRLDRPGGVSGGGGLVVSPATGGEHGNDGGDQNDGRLAHAGS